MADKAKRWLPDLGLILLALLAAAIAFVGGSVFNKEKITSYWTTVELDGKQALVTESIDYDFGTASRRGIIRKVPGLDQQDRISVVSDSAPTETLVTGRQTTNVRIGDPDTTITGTHRYLIEYPLETLVSGKRFSWNAVGYQWEVGIEAAEIHILGSTEFDQPECFQGLTFTKTPCLVEQIEPGHLVVRYENLEAGDGITVSADLGADLPNRPASPPQPSEPVQNVGVTRWLASLIAAAASVGAASVAGPWVRRRGRERVTNLVAARLGLDDQFAEESELATLASPSPAAPAGLTAAQGGILHTEKVLECHKVAWLMDAAFQGEVDFYENEDAEPTLRRGQVAPRSSTADRIDSFFTKEETVSLSSYSSDFGTAWSGLGEDLQQWLKSSDLWDSQADLFRERMNGARILACLLGPAVIFGAAALIQRSSTFWLIPVGLAAGLFGAAWAASIGWHGLRARTAEGSARWVEVESLRQFFDELDGAHATDFIGPESVADYTSWAVALGFDDRWQKAVKQLVNEPGYENLSDTDISLSSLSSSMTRATSVAAFAPASSSSDGGSSFSSGGSGGFSGGGGGGGSW